MPVPAMVEPVGDHQKRFQAAVDVIHKLPKNGSYRPSYEVMLRFYSLYKQAVCGPCTVPRPGFWDPVGRYKWDAWSQLGKMSSESAMAAYVDEMKKVAQEVIETMPMDEKTASLFNYFEPLYLVIDDMPQPPESLLKLREGSEHAGNLTKMKDKAEEKGELKENASPPGNLYSHCNVSLSEVVDLSLCTIQNVAADPAVSEVVPLTSDSESEIFCDSVDSLEQLTNIKTKLDSFHNGHLSPESSAVQSQQEGRKVGAGQGGEGGEGRKDPIRRTRHTGRETSHHNWRERDAPPGGLERSPGGGSGHGHGGDGSEGGAERLREAHLQQQIILALRRLREDMRSVMDRLEVVERLAATHAHASDLRPCLRCSLQQEAEPVAVSDMGDMGSRPGRLLIWGGMTAPIPPNALGSPQLRLPRYSTCGEQNWWPFDVSGQTVLLLLLWPFVAHCLVYLLRKKSCASS